MEKEGKKERKNEKRKEWTLVPLWMDVGVGGDVRMVGGHRCVCCRRHLLRTCLLLRLLGDLFIIYISYIWYLICCWMIFSWKMLASPLCGRHRRRLVGRWLFWLDYLLNAATTAQMTSSDDDWVSLALSCSGSRFNRSRTRFIASS